MRVEILDTVTGERRWHDADEGEYAWTEGNYSCDCNRAILMLGSEEAEKLGRGCLGTRRFRVVATEGTDYERPDFNQGYPS